MKMKMVSLLLLFVSLVSARISHSSPSYYSDQHALLAFKDSLSLSLHNSLQDWSAHHNTCNWTGVVCSSRRQRVVSLNLTGMGLVGPISPFIGNLSFLRLLALKNNSLHGQIPPQLQRLFHLRILRLSINRFEGPIPPSLGSCSSLQNLILSYNNLSGTIPSQLGLLHKLEKLWLAGNQLTGTIPSSLQNLSSLTELDLGINRLHGGIPVELGMLTQLQVLALNTNNFTGPIPTALSNCTHLQYVALVSNQLTGHIPSQFGKLSELQDLYLYENQLSGEIPRSLSNCTLLQDLELEKNILSGSVPLEFGKLLQLRNLFLWNNHLVSGSSGLSILTALTNCSILEKIDLSGNHLTGNLPSSVSQLSRVLSFLALDSNKIEGNIPSGIANLTKLALLDLADNCFNGTIPSAINKLPNLEQLYLQVNNLHGGIPKNIGQAKRLGLLSLSENMLSGKIPDSLGDLPQLRNLLLHRNQLSGKIPATLGRCITLETVDLSYNKLTGNIPPEVAGLPNLQFYFNVSSNFLQGSLLEMSKLVMVQAIDVSHNNFSGEIPAALSSCTELLYLNLSWNSFDGSIPASLTNLKNLQDIDLSNNNLSAEIPMAFEKMYTLQHINLSSNRLTGEVPKGGVFSTLDKSAIVGNLGLCGTWISLQPCSYSKHMSKKVIVPVMIGIVIFVISALLLVFSHRWRRHTGKNTPSFHIGPTKISYEELVDATDGFSQTNLLGVGSFGSIYRGILRNAKYIAVKVLNCRDENAHQSFITECNVFKRVRHRNVIKIISACSTFNFKALVLPFMNNGSLERWLHPYEGDECRLNLSDRLRIATEIAQGMSYLHHHSFVQVIHCDLKPSNVLLGDDMTSYISDFGIAKLLFRNSVDSLTSTHTLKGSIGYIPPEYGTGGRISTKGDVFSYGVLLLEMLTGRKPTDDMFVEGINLIKCSGMDLPNKIVEVVDNNLLTHANESEIAMVLACLTQLMQVGLICIRDLPQQRPNMME
ncbi:hypothetical protein KI387_020857, partial [Taxus chinensis]